MLELLQAFNKCSKDFDELKTEKEHRTHHLNQLKNKLEGEHNNLTKDIAELRKTIFESPEYLEKKKQVEERESQKNE